MMTNTPPTYQKRHRIKPRRVPPVTVPGPNLVTAEFDPEGTVSLTFDQAVDLSQFNGSAIFVVDGFHTQTIFVGTQQTYQGSPEQVQVYLNQTGPCDEGDTILDATGASGIKSVETGGYWSGVSDWVI